MLTDDEFDSILNGDKRIRGTVSWREDEDHSPALHFRIDVESMNGSTMFVHGYYNRTAGTLTYALILRATGRIYALDLGKKHRNPGGTEVGESTSISGRSATETRKCTCLMTSLQRFLTRWPSGISSVPKHVFVTMVTWNSQLSRRS